MPETRRIKNLPTFSVKAKYNDHVLRMVNLDKLTRIPKKNQTATRSPEGGVKTEKYLLHDKHCSAVGRHVFVF